eukprot:126186_1
MVTSCSSWFTLLKSYLLIHLTSSQLPFSLNIPAITKCTSCKFHWPTLSHYGYSFDIDDEGSTIDLSSQLITFSAIAINYDSYNSTHISCNLHSGFTEEYNYQIAIYYRPHGSPSWTTKGTKSRAQTTIDRVPLNDLKVVLAVGEWYIGIRLSWNRLSQQCDFIMDGWNMSTLASYPPNLVSSIPGTNHQITFKHITCLHGEVATNQHRNFTASILPHFDIEFELMTVSPTALPTHHPITAMPTTNPSISPSFHPTTPPTHIPSVAPTTHPSQQTIHPSTAPTKHPSLPPTVSTSIPSKAPSLSPTMEPTFHPSIHPTVYPTYLPSVSPTEVPTLEPTTIPTARTVVPTLSPSLVPSDSPTQEPTAYPTPEPTIKPTINPTFATSSPTFYPTTQPTLEPTTKPTSHPSLNPSDTPTRIPTTDPTLEPTLEPTVSPSSAPSTNPTAYPSSNPTYSPSSSPTISPTMDPTTEPTVNPSEIPTTDPTVEPTSDPTSQPTMEPTHYPTTHPTIEPTSYPTTQPTMEPTSDPTSYPSMEPSSYPTAYPSTDPSMAPSSPPTNAPSSPPTAAPSLAPTTPPTTAPTPHCPVVFVTVMDAKDAFDASDFNGLYTFAHNTIIHGRPVWEVPQIRTDKNIKYDGTQWVINGEHDGVLSHVTNSYYPPQSDLDAKWTHSVVPGLFAVDIKCVDTFAPVTAPTSSPTQPPTTSPTFSPSVAPTYVPSNAPTVSPTQDPTAIPTMEPTIDPTIDPTTYPTRLPSIDPTGAPTAAPTHPPSLAPSVAPSNVPSNAPSTHPTQHPTDSPLVRISPNATHVEMVFLWNVSKRTGYATTIKTDKDDLTDAIIKVSYEYYNASLSLTEVYVYSGPLSWVYVDVFVLCEYDRLDNKCDKLQMEEALFPWFIINELSELNSNLATMKTTLMIQRLSENTQPLAFYPDALTIASGVLSSSGVIIELNLEYLSVNMHYTNKAFDCGDIFLDATLELFGSNHHCTWSTSFILLIHLAFNHDIDFDVPSKHTLLYRQSVFLYTPPIVLQTAVSAPSVIPSPNVIISGSRHIGFCDDLVLNIGNTEGNIGKALYYEWKVYFGRQFLTQRKGFERQFVLRQAALQTFGVDLLRIELYSQNWLGGNNTNVIYVHYANRYAIPSLEIQRGNIQYYPLWESNIIITPIVKPSVCGRNADGNHHMHYSWQQIHQFPNELVLQTAALWPPSMTDYAFNFNANAKVLWLDSSSMYAVFDKNVSVLPSAYFKLTLTQVDADDGSVIASVHDYVAIQFVLDVPRPYPSHTLVHNVNHVLALSIYDFFQFSDVSQDSEHWKFEWECSVFDTNDQQYSKQCNLHCPFNLLPGVLPHSSDTHKVFDDACFDDSDSGIYRISLRVQLHEMYIHSHYEASSSNVSSIIYIHTTTDVDVAAVNITWQGLIPQSRSPSLRKRVSVSWDGNTLSNIRWTCSDPNICPLYQSLSYTDYASTSSHLVMHPYTMHDVGDKYGCSIQFNGGAQYELQMIAEDEYLIASISLSTSQGIRGDGCNLTATDRVFIPMVTVFTVHCGEFTTAAFPLLYNFVLLNNNIPNDEGVWMSEQYMVSSLFQFVVGAGNYSLRVLIQDANGDVHCVRVAQRMIVNAAHAPNGITHLTMNIIDHAVSVSDHSQLIQHTLALSDTLCALHYDSFIDIIDTVDIYLNLSHYTFNISNLNHLSRYKTMMAVYKHLLTGFHYSIFESIMNISIHTIIENDINLPRMLQKLYKLIHTLPYNVLQSYFINKNEWDLATIMSYDLYSDLLGIIHIMRRNRNTLLQFIQKLFTPNVTPKLDEIRSWISDMKINDHNRYVQIMDNMIQNVNLLFSNQFIVGEGISWISDDSTLDVKASRSETASIHCGLTSFTTPDTMVNYINASKTDCIVLNYSMPQWISTDNTSEPISPSIQIDLYSVHEKMKMQTHIEPLRFEDPCEVVVFTLPIMKHHNIDKPHNTLSTNRSYVIPQCVYFDLDTETWSDSGCWMVNYTLNESLCACNHLDSFTVLSKQFYPTLGIVLEKDTKQFEWQLLLQDPVCWLFVVAVFLLFLLSLLCVPPVNSIPLIARSNIILKAERDEMLSSSWIGGVMLVIRRRDKQWFARLCSLYALNLRNQHSLLAICCGMEGMNISTTNLLLIFMCYIVTLMMLIGLYYAQLLSNPTMNASEYSICASLLSIFPLLLFQYLLKNAKPMTASSHYLTVQEKNMETATDCVPLINEDHSVSYSSLNKTAHPNIATDSHAGVSTSEENITDLVCAPMIIPGAEWKCTRCDKFNDADYQFCGYCSHKRLSVVPEATLEPSDSDFAFSRQVQPGSTQAPTMPSMNAPLPMPPPPSKKKKRHVYNVSESSDFIPGYRHNPQQSSMFSAVFADDDLESDSIVISDDEDEGQSESDTATFTKHKKQQVLASHDGKKGTESGLHKPWSMSPSLSDISHTTNTTIGTNIETDLNPSFGTKGQNKTSKHQSNLSDLSDPHSQIGDLKSKIGLFHGACSPTSPVGGISFKKKHYQGKSSTFLSMTTPNKLKHVRGISSMSSGLVNYNTENESFFMTDMETSIDNDNENGMHTPYGSDHEDGNAEEQRPVHPHQSTDASSLLDPFGQVITEELSLPALDEANYNRHISISRRASAQNGTLIDKKQKFALPPKYDTKRRDINTTTIVQQEENEEDDDEQEEEEEEEEKDKDNHVTKGNDDSLSRILVKVQHINDVRHDLIRRSYKLPHCTKHCVAGLMWIYILIGFVVAIYLGTHFDTIIMSTVKEMEYPNECSNGIVPYEMDINYKLSQQHALMSHVNVTDMEYSSTKWALSVVLGISFYIIVFLPIALWIASVFMMYNVYRRRTFDINLENICCGFLLYDVLCCCGKSYVWRNCKKHESDLVTKYGRKTKKNNKDSGNKDTKFHDIPQCEDYEDDESYDRHMELEITEINKQEHERTPTILDSDSEEKDGMYEGQEKDKEDELYGVSNSFTEYAFLCNDKIFVHPTKAEERRLEFMNCGETARSSPSRLLYFRPSSIQQKLAPNDQPKQRKKKRKRNKILKKKRKRNHR